MSSPHSADVPVKPERAASPTNTGTSAPPQPRLASPSDTPSSSPSKSTGQKRMPAGDDAEDKKRSRASGTPRRWSAEEEDIFLEGLQHVARAHLWSWIKEDKRLKDRKSNTVSSHLDAFIKNAKAKK